MTEWEEATGGMRRAKTGGETTVDEQRRDEVRGQAIEDNVIVFIISSSDLICTIFTIDHRWENLSTLISNQWDVPFAPTANEKLSQDQCLESKLSIHFLSPCSHYDYRKSTVTRGECMVTMVTSQKLPVYDRVLTLLKETLQSHSATQFTAVS